MGRCRYESIAYLRSQRGLELVPIFPDGFDQLVATLGALPLVILFTVFSRNFIQGLSQGYGK